MRTYGQYCPIARAAEILAMRWTPPILRNRLLGPTTLNQIAAAAPGTAAAADLAPFSRLVAACAAARSARRSAHR